MKWKINYKIIILSFLLTLLIIIMNKKANINNLYSWKTENIKEQKLIETINNYEINNLYQNLNDKNIDINRLKMLTTKTNIYHLTGDPSWGKDNNLTNIKKEINNIVEINKKLNNKIKGIVFDIEPYTDLNNSIFKKEEFKLYVDIIKNTYNLMKENNLELIICIPYWFDKIDIDLLEEIIKNSDKVEVMNYDINNTLINIKEEINISKKYNKDISTIYEINFNDNNKFKDYNSIKKDFIKIKRYYNYDKLSLSYHHYNEM